MKNAEHLKWLEQLDRILKPVSESSIMLGEVPCVRVGSSQFGAAVELLRRSRLELGLDILEDAFAQDVGKQLEVTCRWISSQDSSRELVIKTEVELSGPRHRPRLSSLSRSWSMAASFELEMEELFGMEFTGRADSGSEFSIHEHGEGGADFPMRKYAAVEAGAS